MKHRYLLIKAFSLVTFITRINKKYFVALMSNTAKNHYCYSLLKLEAY